MILPGRLNRTTIVAGIAGTFFPIAQNSRYFTSEILYTDFLIRMARMVKRMKPSTAENPKNNRSRATIA
jgi:hypothetical protein